MRAVHRFSLVLAFMAGSAQPTMVGAVDIDQSFTSGSGVTGLINDCCAFVGQTYTAGITGTLTGVSVDVHSLEPPPAFDLLLGVQIRTVAGGLPTLTVLGEAETRNFALNDVIGFDRQVEQVAGQEYAITVHFLAAPPQGNAIGAWSGALAPLVCGLPGLPPPGCAPTGVVPYLGGHPVQSVDLGTTWTLVSIGSAPELSQADFHFRTFVAASVPEPSSLGLLGAGLLVLLRHRRTAVRRVGTQGLSVEDRARPSKTTGRGWPSYPKISLARNTNDCGMTSPCALALARFRTSANLLGCSTGMSAGLAPRKMRSTNSPARRNCSFWSTE